MLGFNGLVNLTGAEHNERKPLLFEVILKHQIIEIPFGFLDRLVDYLLQEIISQSVIY